MNWIWNDSRVDTLSYRIAELMGEVRDLKNKLRSTEADGRKFRDQNTALEAEGKLNRRFIAERGDELRKALADAESLTIRYATLETASRGWRETLEHYQGLVEDPEVMLAAVQSCMEHMTGNPELEDWGAKLLSWSFLQSLESRDARDCVEIVIASPEYGSFVVSVQRKDGATCGDVVERLRAKLQDVVRASEGLEEKFRDLKSALEESELVVEDTIHDLGCGA